MLVDDSSETVAGEICHIKAVRSGGPRYDPNQSEEERQSFANLILLCATHHAVIDSDPAKYTVECLLTMKAAHKPTANVEVMPVDKVRADRLLEKYTVHIDGPAMIGTIHASQVVFRGSKRSRPKVSLPSDVVGGSALHRRYISHLIDRYKDFASKQNGRIFRHAVIYSAIKFKFGTTWEWIGIDRFSEFVAFLQNRIDKTLIGKRNVNQGIPNYSSFEQYCMKHQGTGRNGD